MPDKTNVSGLGERKHRVIRIVSPTNAKGGLSQKKKKKVRSGKKKESSKLKKKGHEDHGCRPPSTVER